ncbi:TPA_asm: DNA breaking-rejoining protein [Salmonella enterica subsp. diarizonae]|nr:DNA breaking-rejoining protein [Salmonella enterica subsp. diarizonae]ELI2367686.1 PD-(D/E)XK nuclease-like domain-containing protein [Salmonella enterica]HAB1616822.1 DNA breaking-rejoining protein [Salmonella enterica subsp. diarizonae]
MSENKEDFALHCLVKNEEARKRLGIKAGFFWITAKKLSLAVSRCISAMDDKGYDEDDFKKPVRVNMPVENDLPPEGVFDTKFCANRKIGGADGKTLVLIPGAASSVSTSDGKAEEVASAAETVDVAITDTITDSDDTSGDPLPAYAYNVNGELMSDVEKDMTQSVSGKSFAVRFRANWKQPQCVTDVATWRLQEINAELMDPTGYMADIELALSDKEISSRLDKLEMRDVHCYARDIEKVFPENKRPGIQHVREFTKAWLDTDYIDRGLLVKEWQKGNRVSQIAKPETSDTPEPQKTSVTKADVAVSGKPTTKTTYKAIDIRIGCALTKGEITYPITARIVEQGKAIVEADDEEFKRWSATYRITENIQFYDERTHIEMIRQAPREVVTGSPELRRAYVDNYLAACGTLDSDQLVFMPKRAPVNHEDNLERVRKAGKNLRDIAAGRFKCDEEKPQPTGELADEPATPEAVEQGTTEHHPNPQPLDAQSSVESDKTSREQFSEQLAADRGDFVPGISDPDDPKWVHNDYSASNEGEKTEVDTDAAADTADSVDHVEEFSNQPEPETSHSKPVVDQNEPETPKTDVVTASSLEGEFISSQEWPTYFEPGRYEGVPNDIYHAANGISSTMVKDARVSLMYYEGRHVSKTIKKERSKVLDMGNLVHALALQPEILDEEFSIEPEIPEGALTTTATIRAVIDDYNNGLPVILSADDIKRYLDEYNATLPQPVPLGDDVAQTGESYMSLPPEFQRVEEGQKVTAAKMKACIKEYNATLPPQMKTSGSRDTLLEQLAIINPDLVAQEAQKPQPLKVSGAKADLIQAVKSVSPETVFVDELLEAWRENPGDKILVTRQQYATALAIQSALYAHPEAGKLLQNPTRAVEVSYFGIDDDTGLEIRVRPDVELEYEGLRIGFDLKTISMWDVKEDALKSRLHREITMRDYHLSAGMYCNVADLDKFAWIFVNKDEGYHWVAVVWASESLLELGKLEYHRTIRAIANAMDTDEWPAPVTADYTDELNDYDLRRLDALREMA